MSPLKGRKILVVDDDPALREALVDLLSSSGAEILQAENGTLAFQLVQSQRPDIVVTDVRMPGGDGIELSKNIRDLKDHHPIVIMCSGYNDLTPTKMSELKIDRYFEKPFDPDELVNYVENLFQ